MAELAVARNNALPYPVYGVPFVVVFPMLDADGDLVTGATTPDAEISKNCDTFADCTNESVEIATNSGMYYLSLTGTEMTADIVTIIAKSATAGMKTTPITLYPAKLASIRAGTVGANAADGTTLQLDSGASAVDDYYNGCLIVATIDSVVEARIIADYVGSSKVCTITPAFLTAAPDNNDTFVVYNPLGRVFSQADIAAIGAAAVSTTTAQLGVNAVQAGGTAWASGAITTATFAAGAINAAAIGADAITDAKVASDVTIASVTGAVGSVTGNVGGNVTGSVGSIATGGIVAASFAANSITAAKLDPDVTTELQTGLPTAAGIADAVWDEAKAGHVGAGSTGEAINDLYNNIITSSPGQIAAAVWDEPIASHSGASSTGYALANVDDVVWDSANAVEIGLTPRQSLRLISAAAAGKLSGAATTTNTIRNAVADSKDRIIATVDSSGNRTAITTDVT